MGDPSDPGPIHPQYPSVERGTPLPMSGGITLTSVASSTIKLNCEKKRKSRLRRTLVCSHGACLVSAVVADVAGQAATVAMEQTKQRKGRLAPSSLSGHNHGGFDGWAVHEARSPQATSPLRAAGNAVLAGRRIARERWQTEAPPSEPRSLKVDFFLANAFHITQ